MYENDAGEGLLEQLARRAGCTYLSDLRCGAHRAEVRAALEGLPAEKFPLTEWQETAYYLTGRPQMSGGREELRSALLVRLDEKEPEEGTACANA